MRHLVYTCVTGGFDRLPAPVVVEPGLEYVVFSDDADLHPPPPWQQRPLMSHQRNPRMTARWHKLHPHLLFPDREASLYIDGNVVLIAPVAELFAAMLSVSPIAVFAHPERGCIYAEAEVVKRHRLDDAAIVDAQMAFYRARGLAADGGLFFGGIQLRRHEDHKLAALLDDWWRQLKAFSHRDQLSLPFVLDRHGIRPAEFAGPIHRNPWFAIGPHRRYHVDLTLSAVAPPADEIDWLRRAVVLADRRQRRDSLGGELRALGRSALWHGKQPLRAAKRLLHRLGWRLPTS